MIEVYPKLFVGSDADFPLARRDPKFYFVQAAKEPWHRDALGYKGRSAPLGHEERFIARRPRRLILNMIDADDVKYIPWILFKEALEFITTSLLRGKVLVHCNQGHSRAPAIAFLWMVKHGYLPDDLYQAVTSFSKLYPPYAPRPGIAEFLRINLRSF